MVLNITSGPLDRHTPSGILTIGTATRASPRLDRRAQPFLPTVLTFASEARPVATLPDLTAGRAVLNIDAPDVKVPEICAESASYYVLAFEPGAASRRDSERSVDVRLTPHLRCAAVSICRCR
jgi:hypothetical protein